MSDAVHRCRQCNLGPAGHFWQSSVHQGCVFADAVDNRLRRTLSRQSAGLLLFRETPEGVKVLLVHPGGPYWAKRDDGAWSIPKGEFSDDEEPLAAARREFEEEMGRPAVGDFLPLEPLKQPGGKLVLAWAVDSDFHPSALRSNTFSMEWPPKSGKHQQFPEVDRAAWFEIEAAKQKILKGQAPFLDQLLARVRDRGRGARSPETHTEPPQVLQRSLFGDERNQ